MESEGSDDYGIGLNAYGSLGTGEIMETHDIFSWDGPWLDHLAEMLEIDLKDPVFIRETAAGVKALTQLFVTKSIPESGKSSKFGMYGDHHSTRGGYAFYYLLKNLPKIVYILENTPGDLMRSSEVLDLGTGPGTAILGWLMARHRNGIRTDASVTGVDNSRGFTKLARYLVTAFSGAMNQPVDTGFSVGDIGRGQLAVPGRFSLVIASNVLGEIPDSRLETAVSTIVSKVKPRGYLLLMAPALHWTARRVLAVRDTLCAEQWTVTAPCPGNYPCPAMKVSRDWCHHRLPWDPPEFLVCVDKQAGFKKRLLNFTYIVARNTSQSPVSELIEPDQTFRVVSDLLKMKGKYEIHVCGASSAEESGSGTKWTVVLEKKRISPENRIILDLKRFDRVKFQNYSFKNSRLLVKKETGVFRLNSLRGGVV